MSPRMLGFFAVLVLVVAGDKVDGPVIGIDFGTTFSCVGIFRHGVVEIIPSEQGNRIMPSYVAFSDEKETFVGEAAKNLADAAPQRTVFDVKRLIGRTFKDDALQRDIKALPFKVVADSDGQAAVLVGKEQLRPEEIAGMILRKLRERAEGYLEQPVKHAVLTVPAFFNDGQRRAMQKAGQLAGLEILRILNEPTAAAIAYGYEKQDAEEVLLVYDLGGGTCDVSVLEVKGGVLQVRATSGDPRLGGEDFDQKLVAHLMSAFKKKTAKEPRDARAVARLRSEAEKAKRKLSTVPQAAVRVDGFADGADLSEPLTRAQFEKLNSELFQRTLDPVRSALKDAGLEKSQITQVILAGGSARIPKIQQMLSQFFEKELIRSINPDEVVAHGAAIQAAALSSDGGEEELRLIDVTPLSLGIQTAGGFMTTVLARNSPLPAENSMVFSTHKDNQEYATVKVFEGERLMAKNNHLLGSFQIKGISPAPRGVPQIQVSFKVDANGLLAVEALDRTSGNSEQLEVKEALSQDQIQEMLREAETFAKEDQRDFARAEALLALQLLARAAESAAETALEEDSAIFLAAAAEAKDWLAANPDAEAEEIHEKREELQAEMPEPSAGAGAGAGAAGGELDMEGHDEL